MHAIEFEADIENGLIRIPAIYRNVYKAHARIIVLMPEAKPVAATFNPRLYFGAAKQPKAAIDAYLHEVRACESQPRCVGRASARQSPQKT